MNEIINEYTYPFCNASRMSSTATLRTHPARYRILQKFLHIHIYQIRYPTRNLTTLLSFLPKNFKGEKGIVNAKIQQLKLKHILLPKGVILHFPLFARNLWLLFGFKPPVPLDRKSVV